MPDLIRPAATHGAETLSLGDFLHAMKRSRRLRPMLLDAFVEHYLVTRARRANITVSDKELQEAADNFRLRNGMASSEQTTAWFNREAITAEDFATGLERDLLVEKLRRTVADPKVQEVFNANLQRFARVRIKRILLASEPEAREVFEQLSNGRAAFEDVARAKSLDLATKANGGDAGIVRRVDLGQLGDVIFGAEVGKVVGPVSAGQGYLVFRVEEFLAAELDDAVRNGIRKEVFDQWLRNELSKAPIEFPLLQALSAGPPPR
jgi:parvulin-like peptidyl-prolyl isomerase